MHLLSKLNKELLRLEGPTGKLIELKSQPNHFYVSRDTDCGVEVLKKLKSASLASRSFPLLLHLGSMMIFLVVVTLTDQCLGNHLNKHERR